MSGCLPGMQRGIFFKACLLVLLGVVPPSVGSSQSLPAGEGRPAASDFGRVRLQSSAISDLLSVERARVLWRGREQRVVEVVGGDTATLELGLLVDGTAGASPFASALLEGTRAAVEGLLVPKDRLFVATFGAQAALVASGRKDYRQLLDRLPDDPRAERSAIAAALPWALRQFQGEDARAALVVVLNGCDGRGEAMLGNLAESARERAVPIYLLYAAGDCGASPGSTTEEPGVAPSDGSDRPAESTRALNGLASAIGRTGGQLYLLRDETDFARAFDSVVESVRRQWLVVFEPESPAVRSSDVEAQVAPAAH